MANSKLSVLTKRDSSPFTNPPKIEIRSHYEESRERERSELRSFEEYQNNELDNDIVISENAKPYTKFGPDFRSVELSPSRQINEYQHVKIQAAEARGQTPPRLTQFDSTEEYGQGIPLVQDVSQIEIQSYFKESDLGESHLSSHNEAYQQQKSNGQIKSLARN